MNACSHTNLILFIKQTSNYVIILDYQLNLDKDLVFFVKEIIQVFLSNHI